MEVAIIVAMAKNRVIGNGTKIPWHLPADFKHFKKTTMGCPIIMGRITHESIGRPLPGRKNIVVTRNPKTSFEGAESAKSMESVIQRCKSDGCKKVFVIGGAEIYREAIPQADRLFITQVDAEVDGNVYFPELQLDHWRLVSSSEYKKDDKNQYDMQFLEYVRSGSPPTRG